MSTQPTHSRAACDGERMYDKQFRVIFDALKHLLDEPVKKKAPIGFRMK